MSTAFIINPISGKRLKGSKRKERVDRFARTRGLDAESVLTEGSGHATELALKAIGKGASRIVCIGGDGTINEVAKALLGKDCSLGLVPMGSGNGLARDLGIPLSFDKALEAIASGRMTEIDTGLANGHPFFNVMGIGFDAEVGRRFNESPKRGLRTYLKEGLDAYRTYRSRNYEIECNGARHRLKAYVIAVANSSQYGSNAYIAPDASLQDGLLNLVAIGRPRLLNLFILGFRMFAKTIYRSPRVTPYCAGAYRIHLPESGFFHADGEIFECGREISITTAARSLRVIVP